MKISSNLMQIDDPLFSENACMLSTQYRLASISNGSKRRVFLLGRRPAIVAGRQGAEVANVAG